MINMVKLPTNKSNLFLRVAKGHFATSHSHINYYIDVTILFVYPIMTAILMTVFFHEKGPPAHQEVLGRRSSCLR